MAACGSEPEPAGPSVSFGTPEDGAEVTAPVQVQMLADGVAVSPAGTFEDNSGHFHILVNAPFIPAGSVIPADSAHIHYGDGSTEVSLDLPPGEHTLRLQLADGAHIAMDGLQDEIRITVR